MPRPTVVLVQFSKCNGHLHFVLLWLIERLCSTNKDRIVVLACGISRTAENRLGKASQRSKKPRYRRRQVADPVSREFCHSFNVRKTDASRTADTDPRALTSGCLS